MTEYAEWAEPKNESWNKNEPELDPSGYSAEWEFEKLKIAIARGFGDGYKKILEFGSTNGLEWSQEHCRKAIELAKAKGIW